MVMGPAESGVEVQPGTMSPCAQTWLHRLLSMRYWNEVKEQCKMAGPVFLSQIMVFLINIVSSIFCGHLGKIELDSVTLAVAVINVTGISVGSGLASTCDTLMSQSYGGKNMKRVGTVLQRGILILMLCCFPCWAIFINTEQVLLLCRQDPDVARLTQTYVMIFVPALPAVFLYQLQTRYLTNQGIIWPQVITGLAVNLINVAVNAIFMYGLNLGVVGSAWSNTLSQFAMSGLLFIYTIWKKLHLLTWGGWSRDCLQEWGSFIRLAIPSMLMVCIEWWSFEIGGFLAGLISVVELGAQAIMLELMTAAYMISVGFSVAASVRIGNALGAGDVEQAKTSCKVSLLCIVFCSVLTGSLLAGLKDVIAYIFTSDREIVALVSRLMLISAPFHLCDAIAGTCAGILRGSGKQKIGAITNAVGYYLVGLPVGISLMFAGKLGVIGLWSGMMFPVFLQASFFMIYVLRMNWDKVCKEAQVRAGVKKEDEGPSISQKETSPGFGMCSFDDEYSAVDQSITAGAAILPDVFFSESHSDYLVLEDDPSEASDIVGEVLSTRQLIFRRGLVVCLAVVVLLTGIIIKVFTGNG
ncbi:multidrug and toxin extrusion protein 2-like isoform X1 [Bufo bufo]|uniref:multidrug and toxin extrusion protein 2-like isoform X1 n=2 Tax=Bufo bufo TaxID=8384 RepID=UPI001ABDD0AA|nr:multidrug and toxin extrusion protein 2-like isoform X1 [Bufo bufo]